MLLILSCTSAEKTKSDLAGKLSADLIEKVNAAIVAVKSALEGKDSGKIKAETEKLQKVLGEAGQPRTSRPHSSSPSRRQARQVLQATPARKRAVKAVRMSLTPISRFMTRNNRYSCTNGKKRLLRSPGRKTGCIAG